VYARHLIRDIDGRMDIDCFIDDFLYMPYAPETKIYRSSYLDYINTNDYILISSVKSSDEIVPKIKQAGFIEEINYFNVREKIKSSNIEYIESNVRDIDFSYVTKEDRPDLYDGMNYESKPFDHSSVDGVFDEIAKLDNEPALFDFGCGKGQILLTAYMNGINKLAGIELNEDIHKIAVKNMELLNVPSKIINGDAAKFKELDEYNIFFFYNPFGGEVFERVISNIEESVARTERKIHIVYGNPFNHKNVIASGSFQLCKQLRVDLYDPLLNIYTN
jgi:16S rRNA G966 N2-methylase RsmD